MLDIKKYKNHSPKQNPFGREDFMTFFEINVLYSINAERMGLDFATVFGHLISKRRWSFPLLFPT